MNLDISALLLMEFCLASAFGSAMSLIATNLVPGQISLNAWQVITFNLTCGSQI